MVTGKYPEDLEVNIIDYTDCIEIKPLLLNPLDTFSVRVLVNSTDEELNIKGRIAEVTQIKDITRHVEDFVPQLEFRFASGLKATIGFEGSKKIYRIRKY